MSSLFKLSLPLLSCLLFSCSNLEQNIANVELQMQEVNQRINQQKENARLQLKNVKIIDSYYVPPLAEDILLKPAWWFEEVPFINSQGMPLSDLMQQLSKEYNIAYQFTDPEFATRNVNIGFSGTLGQLFEKLSSLLNLHFSIKNDVILWQQYETRLFDISFMPGSSQYKFGEETLEIEPTNYQQNTTTNSASSQESTAKEYANFAMKSDIWLELDHTIKNMLSPQATYSISPSSSTLTIQDMPWKLDAIENYISTLNKKLSTQIYIDVQVIEVRMNDGMDYGINWNIVKQAMSAGGTLQFNSDFSATTFDSIAPATLSATVTDATSQYVNSALLIDALEQQGQVSVVSSPRVVTLNNQMAEIAITEQITYLAASSSRTTANVGAETTLRPGVVETGLQLYVLPLLVKEEILLQVFGTFSTLQDITTVESNDSKIQAPNIRNKRIMQKAKVKLGDTIMLAGFKNTRNQTKTSGLFGQAWLSGSKSYDQQASEMLILISPHLLNDSRSGASYAY